MKALSNTRMNLTLLNYNRDLKLATDSEYNNDKLKLLNLKRIEIIFYTFIRVV